MRVSRTPLGSLRASIPNGRAYIVAHRLGVSRATISAIELGRLKPTCELMEGYAKLLGISTERLMSLWLEAAVDRLATDLKKLKATSGKKLASSLIKERKIA